MGFAGCSNNNGGAAGLEVEVATSNSTTALPNVKTTVATYTAVGPQSITLIVGTANYYGRWFLTLNASDEDERLQGPSRTSEFGFGEAVLHLDDGDILQLKYQSESNQENNISVNGTIYKAV